MMRGMNVHGTKHLPIRQMEQVHEAPAYGERERERERCSRKWSSAVEVVKVHL